MCGVCLGLRCNQGGLGSVGVCEGAFVRVWECLCRGAGLGAASFAQSGGVHGEGRGLGGDGS